MQELVSVAAGPAAHVRGNHTTEGKKHQQKIITKMEN